MERKRACEIVPPPYGDLFTIYDYFNDIQMKLLNDLLNTDKSIVLSAPTGSGKTVAFELAIVRMLRKDECAKNSIQNKNYMLAKAIYIAPIKALCTEIFNNWKARFDKIGIDCALLTGDTHSSNLMTVRQSQVIISTPEKWDALTRSWRDYEELLAAVQLFVVDEVHLLHEDTRGPVLEAIVARMKSSGVKRFVVASATIPNVEDLTNWIKSCNVEVKQYVFNEMQRPVPLVKHVIGFQSRLKGFQFDMMLNYKLTSIIQTYAESKASLIFCSSRKSAEMAASCLIKANFMFQLNDKQMAHLNQLGQNLIDSKLRKLVEKGIAYHHAGVTYSDRNLIELSFREGYLMILVSTSTLAMGINMPAHLVVIKSTETYMTGGYVEYSENMILQMIGRAGRPQYDTKGVAVVLTQSNKVEKYKKLVDGKTPIESHLHKHLIEHLNSEIALKSITNLELAMNWIRSTYLYIRSVCNPTHYGFPSNISKENVEQKLEELSKKQIDALEKAGLLTINNSSCLTLETTPIGKIMSKYYVSFETMKIFRTIKGNETLHSLFNILVKCTELREFPLRVNEKKVLNKLNKTPIRFPIKGRIKRTEEKISCIMQAVLGNIDITMPAMVQESFKIFRIVERISMCLLEYVRLCVQNSLYRKTDEHLWYQTLLNTFVAAKCFHAKLWEDTEYASKQLPGVGAVYSNLLVNAGKTTLQSLSRTDARTIEYILNKPPPFGDKLLQNLLTIPMYEIKLRRISVDFVTVSAKQVNENYVKNPDKRSAVSVLIVGDSLNNLLHWNESVDKKLMELGEVEHSVKIKNCSEVEYVYGHIIHISLAGVDAYDALQINAPKAVETNPNSAPKKRIKQTKINVVQKINNIHESEFLTETLNEEKNPRTDDTDRSIMSISKNLRQFQYSKRKLSHNKHDEKIKTDHVTQMDKLQNIETINESDFILTDSDQNKSRSNTTVQLKLTEFFQKQKKPNLIPRNTVTIDLLTQALTQKINANCFDLSTNDEKCSISNYCENNALTTEIPKHGDKTQELNENAFKKNIDTVYSNISTYPTRRPDKRKIKSNDSSPVAVELPIEAKKFKNKINTVFIKDSYCRPNTLSSFLGDIAQVQGINSMLEKGSTPNHKEISQHSFTSKRIENSKSVETLKISNNSSLESFVSQKLPLNLSKHIDTSAICPFECTTKRIDLHSSKTTKQEIVNVSSFENPTDQEFSLLYKVAMKFQRLPTQAMSLKNFRLVYNKVIAKAKQDEELRNKISLCPPVINQNGHHSQYRETSLRTNFRLQMLRNGDMLSSSEHEDDQIISINQEVMKEVLNSKCMMNSEDIGNFDEELTNALEELQKEFSD